LHPSTLPTAFQLCTPTTLQPYSPYNLPNLPPRKLTTLQPSGLTTLKPCSSTPLHPSNLTTSQRVQPYDEMCKLAHEKVPCPLERTSARAPCSQSTLYPVTLNTLRTYSPAAVHANHAHVVFGPYDVRTLQPYNSTMHKALPRKASAGSELGTELNCECPEHKNQVELEGKDNSKQIRLSIRQDIVMRKNNQIRCHGFVLKQMW
jgi:hypothetical protein